MSGPGSPAPEGAAPAGPAAGDPPAWWARARTAAGVATTLTAFGIGGILLGEGHDHVAAVFLASGTFRGAWLAKEHFRWD